MRWLQWIFGCLEKVWETGSASVDRFEAHEKDRIEEAMTLPIMPTTLRKCLSFSGGALYVDEGGSVAHRVGDVTGGGAPICAFSPRGRQDVIFLVSANSGPNAIWLDAEDMKSETFSYFVVAGAKGHVHLRHPVRDRYLCAPAFEVHREQRLNCLSTKTATWESFTVVEATPDHSFPSHALDKIGSIQALFAAEVSAESVASWLNTQTSVLLRGVGAAALRILPMQIVDGLAKLAVKDVKLGKILSALMSVDHWSQVYLSDLLAWNTHRRMVFELAIDEQLDFLATAFPDRRGVMTFGSLLTNFCRKHIEPRRGAAVLASARNEGPYFLEWIAHYRALGFEHFFIYSNYNTDGSDELLRALAASEVITWIRNAYGPNIYNLLKAFAHALSCMPQPLDFSWTLIVDLDEFLILDPCKFKSINDFTKKRRFDGATSISFSWKMYTIGGQESWRPVPLLERNVYWSGQGDQHVKTMFVTGLFSYSWPHDPTPVPNTEMNYQNAAGKSHWWPGKPGIIAHGTPLYEVAWVNHYYFKSVEECLWKLARKRHDDHLHQDYAINLNVVMDQIEALPHSREHLDESPLPLVSGLRSELVKLRSLPGVGAAEELVRQKFSASLGELRTKVSEALKTEACLGANPTSRSRAARVFELIEKIGQELP